jgi:EAL domain-containing protein (putative c-di-GMP-specific phosphodiesterase class I)
LERLSLESQLRKGLERNELLLYYQPKVDVQTDQIVGAEALVRWQHPEFGLLSPDDFIPLAEDVGLIVPVGEWVLNAVCQQNKAWQSLGLQPLCVSLNVSGQQFRDPKLVRTIFRALASSGLAPQYLKLELTESAIMENAKENVDALHAIKGMGSKLSIDDFGTGYSSLSYLEQFPLDELKIDRSFITAIQVETDDAPIVTAIIAMAHSLDLAVVVEGVESQEQLAFLRTQGCDEYQGYFFSKPLPAGEFATLLQQTTARVAVK